MKKTRINPKLIEALKSPEWKAATGIDLDKLQGLDKAVLYSIALVGATPLSYLSSLLSTATQEGIAKDLAYTYRKVFKTNRLNESIVLELMRRQYPDENSWTKWETELEDNGWSNDQIQALEALRYAMPSPSDVVRFAVKEAYTPEIAETYGQYQDFPEKAMEDASKIGLSTTLFQKYWAAHWELPSASQGFDMFHRGLITHDELALLLKALDVMPYWRDKLINTAYNLITRVDVRRMWDMRVYDDTQLFNAYKKMGYNDQDSKDLTTWTKVYQTFPDLIARYKNGWINESDVITELVKLGMQESAAIELYQTKIKAPVQQDRVAPERELTKAEIYKGVKQKKLSDLQAIDLIMKMGYDTFEAQYLVETNCHATSSPETPLEFEQLVNAYNKSLGKEVESIPQEKINAERAMVEAKNKLDKAKAESANPDTISTLEVDYYDKQARFKVL